jgi:hypothetical protein
MGRMTVHACWYLVWFPFPQLASYDLGVHFLDATMAVLTGSGHVVPMNAGCRIRVWQDVVCRMAVTAHGRDRQALLVQSLAMNALGIVGDDAVLVDIVGARYLGALLVATAAHEGNVELLYRGARLCVGYDAMSAVAIPTLRGKLSTFCYRNAMDTATVHFSHVIVAHAAVNGFQLLFVWQLRTIQIHVARDTIKIAVHRCGVDVPIHEERYFFPGPLCCEVRIFVTHQAVFGCL